MEDMETQLYDREVSRSQDMNETLGLGIGLFQGATNLFLNGIVLGTIYYGGYLMSSDELSAGDLMSFLVATQTIQRSLTQISLLFGHFVKGNGVQEHLCLRQHKSPCKILFRDCLRCQSV